MEEDIKIVEEKIHKMVTGIAVYRGNDYIDLARIMEREKQALENLLKGYRELEKEIEILREYIIIAPNLDEMTALKYAHIQESAYFRGRAEEQQRANETIHKHFIPKSKIREKMEELEEERKKKDEENTIDVFYDQIDITHIIEVLQELLGDE